MLFFNQGQLPKNSSYGKKGLIFSWILLGLISALFWGNSRYPVLFQKLDMTDKISLDGIGFDFLWETSRIENIFFKILATAGNWYYSNWKGMLFGILFGSAAMLLLNYFKVKQSRNPILNSLMGALFGSPLGLCVNCAAPVGKSFFLSGLPLGTSLSLMVSSPLFNFVSLLLVLSTFQLEAMIFRIIFAMSLVVIVIPLIVFLYDRKNNNEILGSSDSPLMPKSLEFNWSFVIEKSIFDFLKNFFFLMKISVPFMLVAGVFGATIFCLLPHEFLNQFRPTFFNIFVLSTIGMLTPVPILFDVMLPLVLMAAGLHEILALSLLFSLGATSIYPLYLIRKMSSFYVSIGLGLSIVLLSSGFSYLTSNFITISEKEIGQSIDKESNYLIDEELMFVQRNVEEACKITGNKYFKDCLNNEGFEAITRIAKKNRKIGLCSKLKGIFNERCQLSYAVTFSQFKEGIDICEKMTPENLVAKCQVEILKFASKEDIWFAKKIISQTNNCANFSKNSELKKLCQSVLHFSEARYGLDSSKCKRIQDLRLQNECTSNVKKRDAIVQSSSFECNFAGPFLFSKCQGEIVSSFVIRKSGEICEKFKRLEAREHCYRTYHIYRKISADESLSNVCTDLENEREKIGCLRLVVKTRIALFELNREIDKFSDLQVKIQKNQNLKSSGNKLFAHKTNNELLMSFPYTSRSESKFEGFNLLPPSRTKIYFQVKLNALHFFPPLSMGRGVATGDLDGDNFVDILLATADGVRFFHNQKGESFKTKVVECHNCYRGGVYSIAIADMNLDNMNDIIYATEKNTVEILVNNGSGFDLFDSIPLPIRQTDSITTISLADIDVDGDVDIFLGTFPDQKNLILRNSGEKFLIETVGKIMGQTLSGLLIDLDDNGEMDLLTTNDFEKPDEYIFNLAGNKKARPIIPHSPMFSMSIDVSDINNDLKLDVFSVDMSYEQRINPQELCKAIESEAKNENCLKYTETLEVLEGMGLSGCKEIENFESECLVASIIKFSQIRKDPFYCFKIPKIMNKERKLCQYLSKNMKLFKNSPRNLKQIARNVLLVNQDRGKFKDKTEEFDVEASGWSWSARFFDYNLDGYEDIIIGNGYMLNGENTSNIFYKNLNGKKFVRFEKEVGLQDYSQTNGVIPFDMDNDGDLDLLMNSPIEGIKLYRNDFQKNRSVKIKLIDPQKTEIGSKIIVKLENGEQLIRVIKKGGGFLSSSDSILLFGLGESNVSEIKVVWSDGVVWKVPYEIEANQFYRLTRRY